MLFSTRRDITVYRFNNSFEVYFTIEIISYRCATLFHTIEVSKAKNLNERTFRFSNFCDCKMAIEERHILSYSNHSTRGEGDHFCSTDSCTKMTLASICSYIFQPYTYKHTNALQKFVNLIFFREN